MRTRRMMVAAGLALCMAMVLVPLVASAATEAEKQAAIDKALVRLALDQTAGGYWNTYGNYNVAGTGAAVLAFEGQGFYAGSNVIINAVNYGDVVGKGIDYITSQTVQQSTAGKPAADAYGANQYGIRWGTGQSGEEIYQSGIASLALAFSNQPGRVVNNGTEVGRTIKDVVGDSVDYFALAQVTPAQAGGNVGYIGGWRYAYPSSDADNSTSQWPVIAMEAAANKMGIIAPAFVKTELAKWVAYIQDPVSGGSGYNLPSGGGAPIDEAKTGGLLVEMSYLGYTTANLNVQAAINYLNTNWKNTANSTWLGNFGHPYAMWSIYKGLQGMIGLDVTNLQFITNLHADPGDIDNPNHGYNWWEDYCEYLVNTQNANGSWNGYTSYWTGSLATAWYTNILLATQVVGPVIPEPLTCGALMLGLGGLFGYIRRRRLAA